MQTKIENALEHGELVIFHDSNVTAKTNFDPNESLWNDSKGEVSDLTLSELETLNLHVESDKKILTLDDVFESSVIPSGKIRWIFDLKAGGRHIATTKAGSGP